MLQYFPASNSQLQKPILGKLAENLHTCNVEKSRYKSTKNIDNSVCLIA
jgi:hypothetical protein